MLIKIISLAFLVECAKTLKLIERGKLCFFPKTEAAIFRKLELDLEKE